LVPMRVWDKLNLESRRNKLIYILSFLWCRARAVVAYQYIYISYAWQTGKVLQRKNPVTHSLPKRYPASQLVVSIWSHSLDYASRGDWVVMIQEIVEEKIVWLLFFWEGGGWDFNLYWAFILKTIDCDI
jgi:hypothetical protein